MNKTYLLVLATALLVLGSCTKVEVMEVQGEQLVEKVVPAEAGSFMLPVVSNEKEKFAWKLRSLSDWLHVDNSVLKSEWNFNNQNVRINYDSNQSTTNNRNFARVGYLVLETYDMFEVDTIVVKQRGLTPSMKLSDVTVAADVEKYELPFNTNLTDQCRPGLTFSADKDWVKGITYLGNGTHLEVLFSENKGAERATEIEVVFTDAIGGVYTAKCVLTQAAYVEPEPTPDAGEGTEPTPDEGTNPDTGESTEPTQGEGTNSGAGEGTEPGTEQTNPEIVE